MAGPGILYIAEFQNTAEKSGLTMGPVRVSDLSLTPVRQQTVATAVGASTRSTQFNVATNVVRVSNDTAAPCTINFGGSTVTATSTSGIRLSAGQSEYFVVDNASNFVATFGILV